jgi:hypothetical protein
LNNQVYKQEKSKNGYIVKGIQIQREEKEESLNFMMLI